MGRKTTGLLLRFGVLVLFGSITVFVVTQVFFCPMMIEDRYIDKVRHGHLPWLRDSVELYRKEKGHLPPNLSVLVGEHIREIPQDVWGNEYVYRVSGAEFTIYSPGANKIDERGGGDDVILGEKRYSCETYGVNCLRPCQTIQATSILMVPVSLIALALGLIFRRRQSRVSVTS